MNFKPLGLYEQTNRLYFMKPSDFSNKTYDAVQLRKTEKNLPALIMCSKELAPMRWKVVYGFSTVFFKTFDEAVAFCKAADMDLVSSEPGYDHE